MHKLLNKIAIVRTSMSYQSITHYNSQELGLALQLSKKEVSIDIFYASNKHEVVKISNRVNIIYLPTIGLYKQQGLLKNIKFHLKKGNYDLIQVSEESMIQSVFVSKYAKKIKVPVVLLQGMYKSHAGFIKQLFQKTYNIFLLPILRNNIELAICKTTWAEEYLINLNFKKTKVIPVGFNSTIISKDVNPIDELAHIDLSKKIILYIGKIEERRNPDFILELAKSYENNSDIVFICVGNGDLEQDFINKKGANILHFSRLLQNQLQFLYKKASLFLMPTNYEIFGMVYLECMYFGVPVISTLNAGTKDIFDNENDSFILNSLNHEAWKEKIDTILNSKVGAIFSERLKKKSLKYEWEVISNSYHREYENVVSLFKKKDQIS